MQSPVPGRGRQAALAGLQGDARQPDLLPAAEPPGLFIFLVRALRTLVLQMRNSW